jgi:rod shape determining protein RodA
MRFSFFRLLSGYDWVLLGAAVLLMATGLTSLYSTTHGETVQFSRQIIWIAVSVGAFGVMSAFDYRIFRVHFSPVLALYIAGVLGIVLVYALGITVRGARSWIDLGFFRVEPVEPLKIAIILILAKYFSGRHVEMYRLRNVVIPGIYMLIPAVLVFLQPDMGSLAVLLVIWFGVVIVAGIKWKHLAVLTGAGLAVATFAWSFLLYDYQRERVLTLLDPTRDPLGASYQTIQSIVALSSGGLWGKGIGQGTQSQLGFLPDAATDFIFAAIAEELGMVAALVVLALFGVLLWRLMRIAQSARNNFARLAVVGIALMLMAQIFFNIGMVVGLLPVTGLTLPLVSYGGSSMLTVMIALGFANSIHRRTQRTYEEVTQDLA